MRLTERLHAAPMLLPQTALLGLLVLAPLVPAATPLCAQSAAAAAPARQNQLGTVKSVGGGTITVTTAGADTAITLPDAVRVLQVAPGVTDLKSATPAAISDIAVGDKVLVTSKAGDAGAPGTALRVIVMKSAAIAQTNAERQQDWQRRGSGGIVSSVDASAKTIAVTSGTRKVTIDTTGNTVFRRYSPGSVKFEEAKLGSIADLQPGDQLRVRGDKSADATTIQAEEVVSGSFLNLSGLVSAVNASANTVTLKDLATKKTVTVAISSESEIRSLPPEIAARFAARARGTAGGPGAANAGAPPSQPGGAPASTSATAADGAGGPPRRAGGYGGPGGGGRAGGGGDLSQIIPRLPTQQLADLKPGEAVMIVASGSSAQAGPVTAITLLSGVEPLLAASPGSASAFNISPWSLGGGGGEGGGEGAGPQ